MFLLMDAISSSLPTHNNAAITSAQGLPVGLSPPPTTVVLGHTAYDDGDDATRRKRVYHATPSKGCCGSPIKKSIYTRVIDVDQTLEVKDGLNPVVIKCRSTNNQISLSSIIHPKLITMEF